MRTAVVSFVPCLWYLWCFCHFWQVSGVYYVYVLCAVSTHVFRIPLFLRIYTYLKFLSGRGSIDKITTTVRLTSTGAPVAEYRR